MSNLLLCSAVYSGTVVLVNHVHVSCVWLWVAWLAFGQASQDSTNQILLASQKLARAWAILKFSGHSQLSDTASTTVSYMYSHTPNWPLPSPEMLLSTSLHGFRQCSFASASNHQFQNMQSVVLLATNWKLTPWQLKQFNNYWYFKRSKQRHMSACWFWCNTCTFARAAV